MSIRKVRSNQLEKLAGTSKGYVSRLRKGRAKMPTVEMLRKLEAPLGLRRGWLEDGRGPMLLEEHQENQPIALLEERLMSRIDNRVETAIKGRLGGLVQQDRRNYKAAERAALDADGKQEQPDWAIIGVRDRSWDGTAAEVPITAQDILEQADNVIASDPKKADKARFDKIARSLQKTRKKIKLKPPALFHRPSRPAGKR